MQPQAISFIGKILDFRPRHPKLDLTLEFLPPKRDDEHPRRFYMDSYSPPPSTSAPLPPIPSSKRHDFSSRVILFLVSDKQEGQSKALLKGFIFYLQRFLHRDRFSNACKKRDVACDWQDLSSVKFNRDQGLVVNFSKQTHTHPLLKVYYYMICLGDYI